MATRKSQLIEALEDNKETIQDVMEVFWQEYIVNERGYPDYGEIKHGTFNDLPEKNFHAGYGGINGEPCIAFTEKFVYISIQYDGFEWMEAIPRNPDSVGKSIPWPGGG